jgi:hypothetical protein
VTTRAFRAVLLRLAPEDAELLDTLAHQLRSGRAGTAAIAVRHLAATIRRGQPIHIGDPLPPRLAGLVASLNGAAVVVVQEAPGEAGMVLVCKPEDAFAENRPVIKARARDLRVRVRFHPTRASQPGQVRIVARDESGNIVDPLRDGPLSFILPLWSRLLAAPVLGPLPNRLIGEAIPLEAFTVTGDEGDTVTLASSDGRVEVKGVGLRNDNAGEVFTR